MNAKQALILLLVVFQSGCSLVDEQSGAFRDRLKDYKHAKAEDPIRVSEPYSTDMMVPEHPIPGYNFSVIQSNRAELDIVEAPIQTAAQEVNATSAQLVELREYPFGINRVWHLTALAIRKVNYEIIDRDESLAEYRVRFIKTEPKSAEPGLLDRFVFDRNSTKIAGLQYKILLKPLGPESTSVSVREISGEPAPDEVSQKIYQALDDYLT